MRRGVIGSCGFIFWCVTIVVRHRVMAILTCPRDMVILKLCWAAHVYYLIKSTNLPHIFPGKNWIMNKFCSGWEPRTEVGNNATCRFWQVHWAGAAALHPDAPENPLKPGHHHCCALKGLSTEGHTSCSGPRIGQPWAGICETIWESLGCECSC